MRAMRSLSRSQLLVYGAVAVALLLVGARWIRSADEPDSTAGGVSFSPASGSSAPRTAPSASTPRAATTSSSTSREP